MTRAAIRPFRAARIGLAALLVTACGSPEPTPGGTGPAGSPSVSGSPATDLSIPVALEDVATGFAQPTVVVPAGDGSGRLFVAEQPGRIRTVEDGRVLDRPFLDIEDRVTVGSERGLLGVALPPGFGADAPWAYVHYSGPDGETVVSAFRLDPIDPSVLDPGSERVVFTTPQPYANHNGGWIGFDPAGMLLIALGDGGSGGDPENRASNLGELLGKILRLDVSGVGDGEPYAIPSDNPFIDRPGVLPEILHFGLRNPFRASIDDATGDLWIGDVGQNAWEEVDVARAGASGLDFGWRRWEGRHCFNPATDCDPAGVTMPVAEYGHGAGCSVIGGVVYRGEAIPGLRGAYLFADYCSGTLWAINAESDDAQEPTTLLETRSGVSAIELDDDGEVLLTLHPDGRVVRLVAGG